MNANRGTGTRSHLTRIQTVRSRRCRPEMLIERLEDRLVLSTITWDGGGDGVTWGQAANWDLDRLPVGTDQIYLRPDATDVRLSGSFTLSGNGALTMLSGSKLSGGNLYINDTANADATNATFATSTTVHAGARIDLFGCSVSASIEFRAGSDGGVYDCVGNFSVTLDSEHAELRDSDLGTGIIYVGSSATVVGNTAKYVHFDAVASPTVTGNTFENREAIVVSEPDVDLTGLSNNSYTYSVSEVRVRLYGTQNTDQPLGFDTLRAIDGIDRFYITDSYTVSAGALLQIDPGLAIDLYTSGNNAVVTVNGGTLIASNIEITSGHKIQILTEGTLDLEHSVLAVAIDVSGSQSYAEIRNNTFSSGSLKFNAGSDGGVYDCVGNFSVTLDSEHAELRDSDLGTGIIYVGSSATVVGNTAKYVHFDAVASPTVTGNTFENREAIVVSEPDVDLTGLSNNSYTYSVSEVRVQLYGTQNTDQPLGLDTLRAIDGIDRFYIPSTYTVSAGALLQTAPGLVLDLGSTLSINGGTLIASNIEVTGGNTIQVNAEGTLELQDSVLALSVTVSGSQSYAEIRNNTFSSGNIWFRTGSDGHVELNRLKSLKVHADSLVRVRLNDFTNGTMTAEGASNQTIDAKQNWWGTVVPAEIEAKVYHKQDNSSLPLVDFEPFLIEPPVGDDSRDDFRNALSLGDLTDGPFAFYDEVNYDRDVDYFKFTLVDPLRVIIDIDSRQLGFPLDSYARLLDVRGNEIEFSDDDPAPGEPYTTDSYIAIDLQPGEYYVGVSGWPNTRYDPYRQDSGLPGSTGEYRISLWADTPDGPPGDNRQVGDLQLDGNFFLSSDGVWSASGTILINSLLEVRGEVFYDPSSLDVWGNGSLWISGVSGFGDVRVYSGGFQFSGGQSTTDPLRLTRSSLDIVGVGLWVDRLALTSDRVLIQGGFGLPSAFDGRIAAFDGNSFVELSTASGLSFSDSRFSVSESSGLALYGIPFVSQGIYLDVTPDRFVLGGALHIPKLLGGGGDVDVAIEVTNFDGGPPELDLIGTFELGGPIALAPGFKLKDVSLEIDTTADELQGLATLIPPVGPGWTVGLGVREGYFNYVAFGVADLDYPILYSPGGVPLVFLQDIVGGLDELAPGDPPVILTGQTEITAGPEISIGGREFALVRMNLQASWDTGGRFTGTGSIELGVEDLPYTIASGEVIVDQHEGVFLSGLLHGEYFDVSGSFSVDWGLNVQGLLVGTLHAPWWLGGWEIGETRVYAQYLNDEDYSNDFLLAGGSLGIWDHAVEFNLNTGEIDWWADYGRFQDYDVPPPPWPHREMKDYAFDVPPALESMIFRMDWNENDSDIWITDPFGNQIKPEDVDQYPNIRYYKDPDGLQAVFEIDNPAGGQWTVTVTNHADSGGYLLEARKLTSAPTIALLTPELDQTGGPVSITWTDEDSDSDAVITLYYDTDATGGDGMLIVTGISQDTDPDSYSWELAGVPAGTYYVYAVIDDGYGEPVVSYATGAITVLDPQAPPRVTGVSAVEGTDTSSLLVWDALGNVHHYLIRITANAAGEAYEWEVAAGDQVSFLLDGLTTGETYRVVVLGVDDEGRLGLPSEAVLLVPGGVASVPPGQDQWAVFAMPGTLYQAQVPGVSGELFAAIDLPAGASIDGDGLFTWNVPADAVGWSQILVHITGVDGVKRVWRVHLYNDATAPVAPAELTGVAVDAGSIRITAAWGFDAVGNLEYQLERDGQVIIDWQGSSIFLDSGLDPDGLHTYRVRVRDASPERRVSAWSDPFQFATLAAVAGQITFGEIKQATAAIDSLDTAANPAGTQYAIFNATTGLYVAADGSASQTPVWQAADLWAGVVISGLDGDSPYELAALARNQQGEESPLGTLSHLRTLREDVPPVLDRGWRNPHTGAVILEFSEAVAITKKCLILERVDDGSQIDLTDVVFDHQPGSGLAVLRLGDLLGPGQYRLRLLDGTIIDLASNLLDGDHDGEAGGEGIVHFTVGGPWRDDAGNRISATGVRRVPPPGGGGGRPEQDRKPNSEFGDYGPLPDVEWDSSVSRVNTLMGAAQAAGDRPDAALVPWLGLEDWLDQPLTLLKFVN